MDDLQRVKKIINWLIFNEYAENETEIAQKLGYTKSSFSQIVNGKVPLSEKFITNLCKADENINKVWITDGVGEMLKNVDFQTIIGNGIMSRKEKSEKRLIPLYDVASIGGTNEQVSNMEGVSSVSEWIDAGDWFYEATAAIHHYGDSMVEYPSGCILALKEINDTELIAWGKNYVIETDELRITKRIQRGKASDYIRAYSSNEDTYQDGTLIHEPMDIPLKSIRKLALVLGYVVKQHSSGMVYNKRK
jgi:transcriptional regulator with XRE-family HTH domain